MKNSGRVHKIINSVSELIEYFSPKILGGWDRPLLLRGESREYNSPLQPTIARNCNFKSIPVLEKDPKSYITQEEIDEIEKFRIDLPKDHLHYVNKITDDDINILFLARHYGVKTRLLDVTYDPLVALYFACSSDFEDNGYIFFMTNISEVDENFINTHNYKKAFDFDINKHENVKKYYRNINFLYRFPYSNVRVNAQKGAFLFNYNPKKCLFDGTIVYEVPCDKKLEILEHLNFLNISKETLGL